MKGSDESGEQSWWEGAVWLMWSASSVWPESVQAASQVKGSAQETVKEKKKIVNWVE